MNIPQNRLKALEYHVKKMKDYFVNMLMKHASNKSEFHYVMTATTQDQIRMCMMGLKKDMPLQEAKATMKVILDTVLFDYGMHVRIDEFDKP